MNSTSFMEEKDSNPGEEMKEREVVLRQRVLGSLTVSGSLSGHKYQMEPEVGSRVERTSKSGVPYCALGIGMLCKTSCIPSCCFLGIGVGGSGLVLIPQSREYSLYTMAQTSK